MSARVRIAFLHGLLRPEEKLLLEACARRGVDVQPVHVDELVLDLGAAAPPAVFDGCDLVLDRGLSASKSAVLLACLETWGLLCVNSSHVVAVCSDKVLTNRVLAAAGIPMPRALLAFEPAAARGALEAFGYPVVLKPPHGSWGRLLAKVNDADAAEALLEHKSVLGSHQHAIVYAQEYVEKGGYDVRVFVIGDQVLCAIVRHSPHWITNTARGAKTARYEVTPELSSLCGAAARALGGGLLAMDVFVDAEGRLLLNEVNHSMEFRNSIAPTGVDIPGRMVDYLIERAAARAAARGAAAPPAVATQAAAATSAARRTTAAPSSATRGADAGHAT